VEVVQVAPELGDHVLHRAVGGGGVVGGRSILVKRLAQVADVEDQAAALDLDGVNAAAELGSLGAVHEADVHVGELELEEVGPPHASSSCRSSSSATASSIDTESPMTTGYVGRLVLLPCFCTITSRAALTSS
jgi:hypothetical protein